MKNAFDVYVHWDAHDVAELFGVDGEMSDAEICEVADDHPSLEHLFDLLCWAADDLADRARRSAAR